MQVDLRKEVCLHCGGPIPLDATTIWLYRANNILHLPFCKEECVSDWLKQHRRLN